MAQPALKENLFPVFRSKKKDLEDLWNKRFLCLKTEGSGAPLLYLAFPV